MPPFFNNAAEVDGLLFCKVRREQKQTGKSEERLRLLKAAVVLFMFAVCVYSWYLAFNHQTKYTMKKIVLPLLFAFLLPASYSCSTLRNYVLTEQDAATALRQMLQLGAQSSLQGAFSKDAVMAALFPEALRKTLNTLQQLGLTNEVDRFTNTLTTAAEQTATKSVPLFVKGIGSMSFTDAVRIVKSGGTSATDYLRSTIGTELRQSIKPVMANALNEYKLVDQWNSIIKPAQALVGNKLNLDLPTIMAGLVSEKMFENLAQKEQEIRSNAAARTTPLLQKVFSHTWQ